MDATFLFECVANGIIIVDHNFRVMSANPSFYKFFGITEKQALGKRSCDLFRELNFSRCNESCLALVKGEVGGDLCITGPDDRCPHFDCVYPTFDEQGKFRQAMFVLKDAVYVEALDKRYDNKDLTLATIYHDLATPLQVIRACLDVMELELKGEAGGKNELMLELLEASRRNERRLYEMVRTIRAIPRMELDEIHKLEPVEAEQVVERACSDFRLLLKPGVRLECDVPAGVPKVMAEPELLNRIFFNLLDNAARYTHAGGRILMSAEYNAGDSHVTFSVFDDGDPISPELQTNLFQTKHVDLATRMNAIRQDHGWGLYFCHVTVQKFGGRIWVESREGWGTRFSFTLPVAALSN